MDRETKTSQRTCDFCLNKVPCCSVCNASLEKNTRDRLELPFLGYWSENEKYGRYVFGFTNQDQFYCKSCHKKNDLKFKKIKSTKGVCLCENQLEE
jgi:hypothetical protein